VFPASFAASAAPVTEGDASAPAASASAPGATQPDFSFLQRAPASAPGVVNAWHSSGHHIVAALVQWLRDFETVRMAVLPAKQRKKVTLATALSTKGSGVDIFGPDLIEHALASAGIPTKAPIAFLRGAAGAAAAAAAAGASTAGVAFDPILLARLALAIQALPSLLFRLATDSGAPGYALVERKFEISAAAPTADQCAEGAGNFASAVTAASASASGSGATAPSKSTALLASIFPVVKEGLVGTWTDLQARMRHFLASAPSKDMPKDTAAVTADAADAATLAAAEPAADSAAAGAATGQDAGKEEPVDDDDAGFGGVPPSVPYTFTDFAPLLFAQAGGAPTLGSGASSAASAGGASPVASAAPTAPRHLHIIFDSFDAAVDEYFSRLDVMRAERNEAAARSAAAKKLLRIRQGHQEQLEALTQAQRLAYNKGAVVEANAAAVDAAALVIRSALEHGIDWLELGKLVEAESAAGNPVASLIAGMDLAQGRITLRLRDEEQAEAARLQRAQRRRERLVALGLLEEGEDEDDLLEGDDEEDDEDREAELEDEEDDDDADTKRKGGAQKSGKQGKKGYVSFASQKSKEDKYCLSIDIDVFKSAAANATSYYDQGKAARGKTEKTVAAASVALKKAEKQADAVAQRQIAAASALRAIHVARKPAWYERFYWFITTEGLVVVGGRNAQDNEQLVKRYLRPQDAYIHADVFGAATVVLRNQSTDPVAADQLPPLSLEQAGAFCVCLSSAWASNAPSSAWWVHASQVSKTAPTGEYLSTGSFMIRGKKNLLPPVRLELGYALLFKVDESCVKNHMGDRYVRGMKLAAATGMEGAFGSGVDGETTYGGADDATLADFETVARGDDRLEAEAAEAEEADDENAASAVDEVAGAELNEKIAVVDEPEAEKDDADEIAEVAEAEEADAEEGEKADDMPSAAEVESAESTGISMRVRKVAKRIQKQRRVDAATALRLAMEEETERRTQAGDESAAATPKDGKKQTKADTQLLDPAGQMKRGQKAKLKKLKGKYADQDEEDRAAAMRAIGHGAGLVLASAESAAAAPAPAADTPEQGDAAGKGSREESGAGAKGGKGGDRAPKDKARGSKQNEAKDKKDEDDEEEAEEIARVASLETEARALASLVMQPRADDIITHVLPMLCPYSVALQCKYKVKLTPGPLKKGKAGQAALSAFVAQATAPPPKGTQLTPAQAAVVQRERELVKAIPDQELVNTVIGQVKVTAAAASAAPTTDKKKSKGKK
jgi:predicted ribosome quality control (RQC) complex YloA/Tae2 family protein